MEKINQYRRKSIRLKEYDYSRLGEYFVTICTHNHKCIFGEINKEEMKLSPEGMIAQLCWVEIQKHFSNARLNDYSIMPNHIHGIIILTESMVGSRHAVSLREQYAKPVRGSVPTIARSFKSAATKRINEMRHTQSFPVWQKRFYDRIIRSDNELNNIRDYIANNVLQWAIKRDDPGNIPLW